ncbi:MAG: PorT family protein [Flavobacteriales bacterium]|nr:PorT family protein [Flavobacteriales bacterium]
MKKLFLIAAVAVSTVVFGQETKFGAKAGVNLANLTGDVENSDMKVGFYVGGYANIGITEVFSFQPELLYSAQGAKFEESGSGYSYEEKLNLSYLNIPLMLQYELAEGFKAEFGPQVGFLLSAKDKWEGSYAGESESGDEDVKDAFKSIDFGLNIGLNYELESGLNFGARYNVGLSNIADEDDVDVKNAVISAGVGYTF